MPADAERFRFVQISDVHVGNKENVPVHERLAAAVELINSLGAAFVVDTGDVATDPVYAAEPSFLAELAEYRKYMAKLAIPLHIVPGNHDIGYFDPQGPHPSGKPWGNSEELVAAYEQEIGRLNESFQYKDFRFVLVNNNPAYSKGPGHLSAEQLKWVEDELRRGERTFVFCHVELIEKGVGEIWGEASRKLMALCEQYGVPAAAYGHRHEMHVVPRNGVQYIMCPDLKVPGHQGILEYRVHQNRFELWHHDVFGGAGVRMGSYPYPKPCPSQR